MDLSFENPEAGKAAEIFIDWLHAWEHMGDKSKRPLLPHGVFFLAQGNYIVPLFCRSAEELLIDIASEKESRDYRSVCRKVLDECAKRGYIYPDKTEDDTQIAISNVYWGVDRLILKAEKTGESLSDKADESLSDKADEFFDCREAIKEAKEKVQKLTISSGGSLYVQKKECLHWLDNLLKALDNWLMSESFK